MKRSFALAGLILIGAACSSSRPPAAALGEHPVPPLQAATAEEALRTLRAERASLAGARALLRVRVTDGEAVQTFRATVDVHGSQLALTAFTPLGTTAMTVTADGDRVHVHDVLRGSDWDGTAADLSRMISIFPPGIPPADMVWLLLGYPSSDAIEYTATPAGLASAAVAGLAVTFDPPAHPPQRVTVRGSRQTVDVTLSEVTAH
jgi:hypothetical protein